VGIGKLKTESFEEFESSGFVTTER